MTNGKSERSGSPSPISPTLKETLRKPQLTKALPNNGQLLAVRRRVSPQRHAESQGGCNRRSSAMALAHGLLRHEFGRSTRHENTADGRHKRWCNAANCIHTRTLTYSEDGQTVALKEKSLGSTRGTGIALRPVTKRNEVFEDSNLPFGARGAWRRPHKAQPVTHMQ